METELEGQAEALPARDYWPMNVGPIALNNLNKYLTKDKGDSAFGIKNVGDGYYLGKTKVDLKGDDIEIGGKTYKGTPGLWNLFAAKEPDEGLATEEDKNNYVEALIVTDKLLAVDKTGRVTQHSTASKKCKNVIKPTIDENLRLKALLERRKKNDKRRIETKKSGTRRRTRIKKSNESCEQNQTLEL